MTTSRLADLLRTTKRKRPRVLRLTAPSPDNIARPERVEQAAVFTWAGHAMRQWPELRLLFAVPNGGYRLPREASMLVAQGVRSGVPDMLLAVARGGFMALAIEMKTKGKKPTDLQQAWLTALAEQGWKTEVCYSATEAIEVLRAYMQAAPTRLAA